MGGALPPAIAAPSYALCVQHAIASRERCLSCHLCVHQCSRL